MGVPRPGPPNGRLVREMGPFISKNSSLVKYYSIWPDSCLLIAVLILKDRLYMSSLLGFKLVISRPRGPCKAELRNRNIPTMEYLSPGSRWPPILQVGNSEFHYDFSRGSYHFPKGSLPFF